jgi:acetyltransferase-like isoleucine patch superfamily enzyme
LWCKLFRPRVSIGSNFKLDGKLKIRGSGRVIIGNNVLVSMLVTPYTYSRDALIEIGDEVFLNGTRFGCKQRITVGARCILADCRISDYDHHSTNPEHRNDPKYIKSAAVTIGENVWIAASAYIQKGVTIGEKSTIAAMSLVRGNIPPLSIAGGNPATVWKTLRPDASLPEQLQAARRE